MRLRLRHILPFAAAALGGCDLLSEPAATVAAVKVVVPSVYLPAGDTVRLVALVSDARDRGIDRAVSWVTSDSGVATVSSTGLVLGRTEGAAALTARIDGREDSIELRVVAPTAVVRLVNFDAAGNRLTRFDTDGHAIDAHGGEIRYFEGAYYWYGEHYSCGFQWITPGAPFCGFRVYSSPDLVRWTDRGFLFDATHHLWQAWCEGRGTGCFRPHVERSPATGRYVLWINSYGATGGFWIFEATSPAGPFEVRDPPRLSVGDRPHRGDGNLFVDDDGTGYAAYTHWLPGGDIVIEELEPDLLNGTGRHVELGLRNVEAPSLFKRGERYYLTVSDPNCGYCTTGTSYLTAAHPLGPWSAPRRITSNSCGGQPTHVSTLPAAGGGTWYLYQSDLWNHEEYNEATADQFWAPLSFDAAGEIRPILCAPTVYAPVLVGDGPSGEGDADRYRLTCDIGTRSVDGRVQREVRFTPTSDGRLRAVSFNAYQRGARNSFEGGSPDAPLVVEVRSARGEVLQSVEVAPRDVAWSARKLDLPMDVPLAAGQAYAVRLGATPTRGCYGLAFRDDLPAPPLASFVSRNGGRTWSAEPYRTVKLEVSIDRL